MRQAPFRYAVEDLGGANRMLSVALVSLMLRAIETVPDGGGMGTGIIIDFSNLQWWQTLVGIIGVLGLSPAPWILGLATGKIQFAAPAREDFNRQNKERDEAHDRELSFRDRHHDALMAQEKQRYSDLERSNQANAEAAERERRRADEVTDAALEMAEVVRANTHVVASVGEAARIATTEDRNG